MSEPMTVQCIWQTPAGDGRITGIATFRDKVLVATESAVYTLEADQWFSKYHATRVEPRGPLLDVPPLCPHCDQRHEPRNGCPVRG